MKSLLVSVAIAAAIGAQNPPATGQQGQAGQAGQRGTGAPQAPGGQRGGGRGRGAVQVMTLATTAWTDGGVVPIKYSQAGAEVSPPLAWSNVPDTAASFVLIVHDIDAAIGPGTDDVLHWLVWNIPATTRSLAEHIVQGPELPDGMRQISVTGPYYRGPAAPVTGPVHHYIFEVYALDSMLDVKPVGASPPETRAAIIAAMAGHVRGKATLVGVFKYTS